MFRPPKSDDIDVDRFRPIIENSLVISVIHRTICPTNQSIRVTTKYKFEQILLDSHVFRWGTVTSDPTFKVIDLRDTYTIRPLINLGEHLASRLTPAWHQSRSRRTLAGVVSLAARTRVVQWIARSLSDFETPNEE